MFLAIDIGNTNVTCGVYDNQEWIHIIRISTGSDDWEKLSSLKIYSIKSVAVSSVVPKLTNIYTETITNIFHLKPFEINYKNSGVILNVDVPGEVGTDRICNSVAAKHLFGSPAIIGDIGSATNYDVIDEGGSFIGGAIAPGLETAAKNLFKKAALLKEAAFTIPDSAIGKDTPTNLQSGIMLGAIDVIDGMFNRIISEKKWKNSNNIITGGFGALISPHLKTPHVLLPTLTLDGIRIVYNR